MNEIVTDVSDVGVQPDLSGRMPSPTARRCCAISLPASLWLPRLLSTVLCFWIVSPPSAQAADKQQKLESLLQRFPGADSNKDGKLSREEAKAHLAANPELRQKRQADAKGNADGEGEGTVSDEMLALFEAREFKGVKYRLLKPIDLAENAGKKYPMILSLHGAAGVGKDNVRNLREWGTILGQEEFRRKHPCFVVVPQSPGMWQTPGTTTNVTKEVRAKLPKIWQDFLDLKHCRPTAM
jgi:hypothetical protein